MTLLRILLLGVALAAPGAPAQQPAPDAAAEEGLRHLEDRNDPRTQEFLAGEAQRSREALERLPGRAEMLARVRALSEAGTTITGVALEGARVFYFRQAPRQPGAVLCVRDWVGGAERVLVDPQGAAPGAGPATIDWFVPSPGGHHVAYGLARGGSEDAVLRVVAVDTARDLPLEIDRARFNANLAWHPDGRSFYYARIPDGNAGTKRFANVRLYRHLLGRDTARDEIVFAPGVGGAIEVPEFVEPSLTVPAQSRFAYAVAREGARTEIAVYVAEQKDLAAARPRWHRVASFADGVTAIEAWGDDLYLLTHKGAPRARVLHMKGGDADVRSARVAVPQGDAVIRAMALARDALYLVTMVGGVDRLERMNLGILGSRAPEFIRLPFDNTIAQLIAHPRRAGAIVRLEGWIEAPAVVEVEARTGNLRNTRLQPPGVVDFSAMDEVRLYAPAHDGSKIPVTLVYLKSTQLNGANPTLLFGHGSYGATFAPSFDAARLAWLERGGVLAIAHVRGGGEYGVLWHEAGRGPLKINTVRDFISVADFLVGYGFTSPRRLAIQGTGAGAIAAGGALVRRPELFAAAILRAPLADMLRAELMPGGPSGVPEFGSAARPRDFEALREISSYQQVREASYPAVLLTAGMNDARVEPWQAAKMAARLQSATTSGKPVLLRIDRDAGHGPAPSRAQRDLELADIYSFLLWQFDDPRFQPPPDFVGPPAPPVQ